MAIKVNLHEAGTQLHLTFSKDLSESVTFHVFTKDSIDVKIWENKHICSAQAFIDVDDLLHAADLIREIRKDLRGD